MFLLMLVDPSLVRVMSKDVPPMSTVMMFFQPKGFRTHTARPAGAEAGPELMA